MKKIQNNKTALKLKLPKDRQRGCVHFIFETKRDPIAVFGYSAICQGYGNVCQCLCSFCPQGKKRCSTPASHGNNGSDHNNMTHTTIQTKWLPRQSRIHPQLDNKLTLVKPKSSFFNRSRSSLSLWCVFRFNLHIPSRNPCYF